MHPWTRMWTRISLCFLFGVSQSFAGERHSSQARLPNESYESARSRYWNRMMQEGPVKIEGSAEDSAVPVSQLDYSSLPQWTQDQLAQGFHQVRDERFLVDPDHEGMLRRISWLYPDDGCFARTATAAQRLESFNYPRPKKLFVFGRLVVQTPNSRSGKVSWWYHVVPAISVSGKTYVIDPAMDPSKPLSADAWYGLMGRPLDQLGGSLCSTYAYEPGNDCQNSLASDESDAPSDQAEYLSEEWSRVESLGRNPEKELGDSPPW